MYYMVVFAFYYNICVITISASRDKPRYYIVSNGRSGNILSHILWNTFLVQAKCVRCPWKLREFALYCIYLCYYSINLVISQGILGNSFEDKNKILTLVSVNTFIQTFRPWTRNCLQKFKTKNLCPQKCWCLTWNWR